MSIYSKLQNADRFDNYRELTAKFDSIGKCGHPIKKNDIIGWNKRHGVQCAACWQRWVTENHEAEMIERGYMHSPW